MIREGFGADVGPWAELTFVPSLLLPLLLGLLRFGRYEYGRDFFGGRQNSLGITKVTDQCFFVFELEGTDLALVDDWAGTLGIVHEAAVVAEVGFEKERFPTERTWEIPLLFYPTCFSLGLGLGLGYVQAFLVFLRLFAGFGISSTGTLGFG